MQPILKKTAIYAVLMAGAAAVGCSASVDEEAVGTDQEALDGSLNPKGFINNRSYTDTSEANREHDTEAYYQTVRVGADGLSFGTIRSDLNTLTLFIQHYGFSGNEQVARYYNRGDLGIGREMHCVDRTAITDDKQIACYVKNFAAGDSGTEFQFGQSANVAFKNMNADTPFATVAMVFRPLAGANENRVFFAVYDQNNKLSDAAALDRHAINFVNGKPDTNGQFATPGVHFNNHIPSNCMSCHGGTNHYNPTNHTETGALFLPFDLDQFEYQNAAGQTRAEQLTQFKHLNEIVRKVAAKSEAHGGGKAATNLKNQLDGWYGNTSLTNNDTETFEGNFNSAYLPPGWSNASIYQNVVRPTCRNCHAALTPVDRTAFTQLPFNTEADFNTLAGIAATRLCDNYMPHALQTMRLFWQSSQPQQLEDYWRSQGQTSAADTLHNCRPHNLITLDPQHVMTAIND